MPEYIDKAELLRSLERKIKADNERRMAVVDSDFIDLVNDATVIEDVVEVVRCKDCAFAKKNYLVNGLCLCEKTIHDVVKGEMPRNTVMDEDDFCSYGERKE